MVIFGGLELVAAGYLLHRHIKHKEQRRLQAEAASFSGGESPGRNDHHQYNSHYRSQSLDGGTYTQNGQGFSRVPQPQNIQPVTSQPPRPNSALPLGSCYPQTGWPAGRSNSYRELPNERPPIGPSYSPEYTDPNLSPKHQYSREQAPYNPTQAEEAATLRSQQLDRNSPGIRPLITDGQMSVHRPIEHDEYTTSSQQLSDEAHSDDLWDPPPEYRA